MLAGQTKKVETDWDDASRGKNDKKTEDGDTSNADDDKVLPPFQRLGKGMLDCFDFNVPVRIRMTPSTKTQRLIQMCLETEEGDTSDFIRNRFRRLLEGRRRGRFIWRL
jgi:hypothetical protein